MRHHLEATTPAGHELVAMAESFAEQFAPAAAAHDRDGSFAFDHVDQLAAAGFLAAPVPVQLGGLGVDRIHDVLVAVSRLARGDAATTIGINMHLVTVHNMVRRWQVAVATGNERRARAFAASLERATREQLVIAAAVSEPAQHMTRPTTRAERDGDGWVLNGRKIMCTMSPAADELMIGLSYIDDSGVERYAYTQLPVDLPGVTVHDDWDALGMRASGSNSVTFDDVRLPDVAVRGGFRAGELSADFLERLLTSGLFHAAASLGVAESVEGMHRPSDRSRAVMLAAENAIELAAMRALFGRAGDLVDRYFDAHATSTGSLEAVTAAFAHAQSAKTFVNAAAVRVVDRAMELSGGAGYAASHPIARAARDVRAGMFMHPLGANRAYDFIGRLAMGLPPDPS